MIERRRFDVLVVLTAPPHVGDALTTVLRLVDALLARGRSVRVWACGYNTMLTQTSLGDCKPVNLREADRDFPSAAELVRMLVRAHGARLSWVVCTACSAERGTGEHIPEVRMRSDGRLAATVAGADRVVYVGGA